MDKDKLKKLLKERYEYLEANEAQPEVMAAIERWRQLPEEARKDKPLLYWLLGEGTPDFKMEPDEAAYVDKSEVANQTCVGCEFAYKKISNGGFICSQVKGYIEPEGWCKLYKQGTGK